MVINHNCNGHKIVTGQSFLAIRSGKKRALVMEYSEKYKVNDIVIIQEKSKGVITGRTCTRQISFIEQHVRNERTILNIKPLYI